MNDPVFDEHRRDPRRAAAADLHLLPSGARPRGAGRADAAPGRRPEHVREIARALLSREPTMAQRLVRAKRKMRAAAIPLRVPAGDELPERGWPPCWPCVYLVFNEGYAATAGRRARCATTRGEAMRLARVLVELMPDEREAAGLLGADAAAATRGGGARVGADGEPGAARGAGPRALGPRRDRRGRCALAERALRCAGRRPVRDPGGDRARARRGGARRATPTGARSPRSTASCSRSPSPVVELNRAVAVAMADGPAAGLAMLDALEDEPRAGVYHLLHAARADLLRRSGRADEAADAYRARARSWPRTTPSAPSSAGGSQRPLAQQPLRAGDAHRGLRLHGAVGDVR